MDENLARKIATMIRAKHPRGGDIEQVAFAVEGDVLKIEVHFGGEEKKSSAVIDARRTLTLIKGGKA